MVVKEDGQAGLERERESRQGSGTLAAGIRNSVGEPIARQSHLIHRVKSLVHAGLL